MKKKQYSAKQKAQIVLELWKEEKSLAQIAAEYGVHPSQLYRWRDQAQAGLPELFEKGEPTGKSDEGAHQREKEQLYAEIGRLSTQLAWLKKKSGLDPIEK